MKDSKLSTMGQNSVSVEGNIVTVRYIGDQGSGSSDKGANQATNTREAVENELKKLRMQGKKAYLLLDTSQLTIAGNSKVSRAEGKKVLSLKFDAIALVGPTWVAQTAMYLIKASGTRNVVEYFNKEQKALDWLHTNPSSNNSGDALKKKRSRRTTLLIVAVVFFGQLASYGLWAVIDQRVKQNSIQIFNNRTDRVEQVVNERVEAYVDALYGFRALFASSDEVDQGEFEEFYKSTNIDEKYPGFSALSYIARVPDSGLNEFVAKRRADTSLNKNGNPDFKIIDKSDQNPHYIVAYIAKLKTGNPGTDLSGNDARRNNFVKAARTGEPSGSATLEFDSLPEADRLGFIISMPVYQKGPSQTEDTNIGVVNAVFGYNLFFSDLFGADEKLLENAHVTVTNPQDGQVLFESNNEKADGLETVRKINVAGQEWDVSVATPTFFGVTTTQERSSYIAAIATELVVLLLVMVLLIQSRSSWQAFELADRITEDLQDERNQAITIQTRDDAILQSIGDGVFVVNKQREIILFNKAAQAMSGVSEQEALGKNYQEVLQFVNEKTQDTYTEFLDNALLGMTGKMRNGTLLKRKDGNYVPVADSAAPILVNGTTILGAVVVFRDVTEEKRLDQAKDDFLGLVSHQLQTPATAVKQFIGMLLEGYTGEITAEQRENLEQANLANNRQIFIIQDLLNVARLESGKLSPTKRKEDLSKLMQSTIAEQKASTDIRKQTINSRFDPVQANVDSGLIRLVFDNLLSNASKYTPDGGAVEVKVWQDQVRAYVSIKDSGVGIKAEDQPKLFQRFFRSQNPLSDKRGGSGLGLYICRLIVQLHKGDIKVDSEVDKGSTFTIILPKE